MKQYLFLTSKPVIIIFIGALLSGCAPIPPKTPVSMNYAYLTEKHQPGNAANQAVMFKPSYTLRIKRIDTTLQPNSLNLQTFLISPGKHSVTVYCSVVTFKNTLADNGYGQYYMRTLNFTAADNGNYAVEYDFPSTSNYVVYDNPCEYAVIKPIAAVQ